jgi:hypothetical protein
MLCSLLEPCLQCCLLCQTVEVAVEEIVASRPAAAAGEAVVFAVAVASVALYVAA